MRLADPRTALACLLFLALASSALAGPQEPSPPAPEDRSALSLRTYQRALVEPWGGDYRAMPLERKADHYEWMLWRYHRAPHQQILPRVSLPDAPDGRIEYGYGSDISTWNGALLAALSYEYAVRRRPETLERISELLQGLHLFLEATGQPGLPARCVLESESPIRKATQRYEALDGTRFHYRADPAKGTYNQLVVGYATLMMLVAPDLPEPVRRMAQEDLTQLALHLIRHDYRITGIDGEPTRYGSLRPLFWGHGVPFNAQVAYLIVATAHYFPPHHEGQSAVIEREFRRLRYREHAYYESPWKFPFLVHPQRVGKSRFVDANDLNHVSNAAYVALSLELDAARREGREPDATFLYQLGRTLYWSMERLEDQRNSLCNFMWAGLLKDPAVFRAMVPRERERTLAQLRQILDTGVEQLRRFPLDRFRWEGRKRVAGGPQWMDAYRPDSYYWKSEPDLVWEITGPPTNLLTSAIDYLHAYWLFRYHGLDESESVAARHAPVLALRGEGLHAALER